MYKIVIIYSNDFKIVNNVLYGAKTLIYLINII